MRRMKLWAASLVVVLGLTWAAVAQPAVNPAYQMWAAWSEGTVVTLKSVTTEQGEAPVNAKMTQTLKKVTAEKVVVEVAYVTEVGGMTFQVPPQSMDIPAKVTDLSEALKAIGQIVPQGTPKAPPASKSKETKGRETLTINGKKVDCEWVQVEEEDGSVSKVWSSDDVPGRMVKVEAKRSGTTGTTVVQEWKGTKK